MCWNQYTVAAITNLALELHRTLLTGSNYKYSQANCKAKPPQALTAPSYKRKWKRRWIELSDSRDGREGIGSYPNLQDYFWGEGKFDDILSYHIYIKFIENDRAFLADRSVREGRLRSRSWRGEDLLLCTAQVGLGWKYLLLSSLWCTRLRLSEQERIGFASFVHLNFPLPNVNVFKGRPVFVCLLADSARAVSLCVDS